MSSTGTRPKAQLFRRPVVGSSDLAGMANPPAATEPTLLGEMVMEVLGSAMIAVFGFGVVAQLVAGKIGDHDSVAWSWGLGVTFGILVAGKVTGAHLNPAVTLAVAVFKGFPWKRVLPYILAQLVGFFLGSLLIRMVYTSSIDAIDPKHTIKTQGIFSTLPGNGDNSLGVTTGVALVDQIVGTAILLFLVFAITDQLNSNPSPALTAVLVGLIVVGIGFAMGTNDGYAINPARDFAPRVMEWITGYQTPFQDQHGNVFFWVPIVGPLIGGLIGGGLYQVTVGRTLPLALPTADTKTDTK